MIESLPSFTKRLAAASLLAALVVACDATDAIDEFGTTALMRAARRGDTASVYRLIATGADVNATVPRRDVKEFITDVAKLGELPKWDVGFTPLMYATKAGQSRVVRILIDSGANVSTAARYGETALAFALARNDIGVVRQLTQAGATANPAQFAKVVVEGPAELVRVLAQRGADANGMAPPDQMRGRPWQMPLLIAATLRGDTAVIRALIDAGAKVNVRDQNGWTALRWARDPEAQRGNPHIVAAVPVLEKAGARDDAGTKAESLFDAVQKKDIAQVRKALGTGANANVRDKRGVTPIIVAAQGGSADIVKALLAAGANPNVRPFWSRSPLTAAIESGDIETVRALLVGGAKSDQEDGGGWSPLFVASLQRNSRAAALLLADSVKADILAVRTAARLGDTAMVQLLLDYGADARNSSALVAAIWGCSRVDNTPVIRLLLKNGAKTRQQEGYNMLWRAIDCEPEAVRLLVAHGADPNERDPGDGTTPLMIAAVAGKLETVKVLLAAGADPDIRDSQGRRARDWAKRKYEVAAFLAQVEKDPRGTIEGLRGEARIQTSRAP